MVEGWRDGPSKPRVRIKKRRLRHLHVLVHVLLHAYLLRALLLTSPALPLLIVIDSRGIHALAHVGEVKVIKKAISTKQFD